MVEDVPGAHPADVVRLLFEARAAGDDRGLIALLSPGITAMTIADGVAVRGVEAVRAYLRANDRPAGRRTEVQAHRFVSDGDAVIAFGRIRVFDDGALSDSPAAWRFTVRDGLIERIEPFAGSEADLADTATTAAA